MTTFEWQVPFLVLVLVAGIVYVSDRRRRGRPRRSAVAMPTNGPELIERLQQTLGMSIVIDSVTSSEVAGSSGSDEAEAAGPTDAPHTIHATLTFGRHTAPVVAVGPTESDAWSELARMAVAWRNVDYQHLPMWWGGS
ncbi:MAG TPA: hypothetical protein VM408_04925 [Methylomirabilota bacterium]|nr:hypothetical protein [Methylomirabilota bacterium]